MRLDRNDRIVAGLAILIAAVFVTTSAGWGVPLIGDSHRWAAGVVLALGLAAGALSSPGSDPRSYALAALVLAGFLFAVLVLATGSLLALALLVATLLALVVASIGRHVRHGRGRMVAAYGAEEPHGTRTAAP